MLFLFLVFLDCLSGQEESVSFCLNICFLAARLKIQRKKGTISAYFSSPTHCRPSTHATQLKDVETKISDLRKMANVMKMPARQEVIHLERKCALHLHFLTMHNCIQAARGKHARKFSYMCNFMLSELSKDFYCKIKPCWKKGHLLVKSDVRKGRKWNLRGSCWAYVGVPTRSDRCLTHSPQLLCLHHSPVALSSLRRVRAGGSAGLSGRCHILIPLAGRAR